MTDRQTFDQLPEHIRLAITQQASALGVRPELMDPDPFMSLAEAEVKELRPGRFEAHKARHDRRNANRVTALQAAAAADLPSDSELSQAADRLGLTVDGLKQGYIDQRNAAAAELKRLKAEA